MEGISDCPGEPCDTSIPRIRVGALETTGRAGDFSTANNAFNPPSCKRINDFEEKNMPNVKFEVQQKPPMQLWQCKNTTKKPIQHSNIP